MALQRNNRIALLVGLFAIITVISWQAVVAEDVVHAVSGVVKSVDKSTKTMVVTAADGTEHTFKYTGETTVKAAKGTAKGTEKATAGTFLAGKEGSKVTVKYTENGSEKTAVGIEAAGKAVDKAVLQ